MQVDAYSVDFELAEPEASTWCELDVTVQAESLSVEPKQPFVRTASGWEQALPSRWPPWLGRAQFRFSEARALVLG